MGNYVPLKFLFNEELVEIMADSICKHDPNFSKRNFVSSVTCKVEKYGLNDFETSCNAMYEITKRNTAEYAIRPFLETYHEETLHILQQWIHDENSHIRRLVSEGTRPRLPWAKKIGALKGDFKNNLQLLEPLMNDPSKYVQKSVANHINDITKEDKELVFQWLQQLRDKQHPVNPWIIKHGLRTVIKSGNLPKDFSF
ncbi:DNA alkylation repair protein [Bacillus wiedmannii]|uniref:DNA alkylation repair protein n=1 Tax=Bacillus wiedmannii TaxID=1890302 RepID=UPI000BED949C|nr:DNA alkylation repair protein [Bacillus wiedmannii]MCU5330782.1 DNA alkylation repair protein [Bacillus wiedmannii]PEF34241.1 DNA alkylation repair protein [Bacillus wiedmannii]PEL94509.1 DNA alkylation repair protein [Bacillus wiedmannii]PRT22334.1 DNA alkylation repair protein [Bacillus wiedmannii]